MGVFREAIFTLDLDFCLFFPQSGFLFLEIRAKWSMWSKMRVMSGPVSNKGVPIDVVNCFSSW